MRLSTEIGSIASICGEAMAIEYAAKAGFDGYLIIPNGIALDLGDAALTAE